MTEFTSLKAIALLTKLYTGYAYSLAFIFQSSLVLIMAVVSSVLSIHLYRKVHLKTASTQLVRQKSSVGIYRFLHLRR